MKDSALFTGVTREMGKRGVGGAPLHIFSCPPGLDLERQPLESKDPKGVSSYVSFPECAPTHTPCPQHFPNLPPGGESQSLCPSDLGLWSPWLPHPFTDSSFLPQQLPRPAPSPPGSAAAQWFGSLQIP